jgi:hypothetical protein
MAAGRPFTIYWIELGEFCTWSDVKVPPFGKVSSIHPAAMNTAESIANDFISIFFILREFL